MKSILRLSRKAEEIGLQAPREGNQDVIRDYVYGNSERVNWMMNVMTVVEGSRFPLLYTSAWFTRMWIVQEALLAKHLLLYYDASILK